MSKIKEKIETKLPVPLTDDEKQEHRTQVVRMLDDIDDAMAELNVHKLKNKMAVERLEGSISQKRNEIKNGIITPVECEALYDLDDCMVTYVRLDTNVQFDKRAMTQEEIKEKRQLKLVKD